MKFLMRMSLTAVFTFVGAPMSEEQVATECRKIVIDDCEVLGAAHMPQAAKEKLITSLKRRTYEEGSQWTVDVKDLVFEAEDKGWPEAANQGYWTFSTDVEWKPTREEPGVLHVFLTIRVNEGQPRTLKEITFTFVGAPVMDERALRALIPLKDGETYNVSRFRAGEQAILRAYQERGFIDLTTNDETRSDDENQTVAIVMELNTGPLYRVGLIQVRGLDQKTEVILRSLLKPGSVANPKIVEDFYRDNKTLLPASATPQQVEWLRGRDTATVNLNFDFRP
jgi:outer membrane protein assembly factor BamA